MPMNLFNTYKSFVSYFPNDAALSLVQILNPSLIARNARKFISVTTVRYLSNSTTKFSCFCNADILHVDVLLRTVSVSWKVLVDTKQQWKASQPQLYNDNHRVGMLFLLAFLFKNHEPGNL